MKKKIVSVSLALVFVMAVLAGCAGKSGESGSGPGSGSEAGLTENGDSVSEDGLGHIGNGEDITLKMLATQEDQEVLKEMADAFARKYSEDVNLTVELEACPQKDINKKILTNLELAADLYMFPNDDLRFLAESGALQEVSLNTDKIIEENITYNMTDKDKIRVLHDYIINNTKYDVTRANEGTSSYDSSRILGLLYEHYAICSGYADTMAVILDKLGINNYKVASKSHVWNAVYLDNKWYHLDLTWDDPVSTSGKDILDHTYFLIDTSTLGEVMDNDDDEHVFDKKIYSELK